MVGRNTFLIVLLAAQVVAFGVYLPVLGFSFTYDDFTHIHNNPLVINATDFYENVAAIFTTPTAPGNLYRPLVVLSYYIQYQLFGLDSFVFHATNIAIHGINGLLVFLVLLAVLSENTHASNGSKLFSFIPIKGVPFASAFVFLVHPMHVEAVANVAGRTELFAFAFGMSALLLLLKERNTFVAIVLLACAMLSKESALAVGLLFAVWRLMVRADRRRSIVNELSWIGFPILVVLLFRTLVLGDQSLIAWDSRIYHPENPFQYLSFTERLYPSLVYLGRYLALLVIPAPLSADYSIGLRDFWLFCFSQRGLLYFALLGVYTVSIVVARNKFLGLWFFVSFVVTCNLFTPTGTIMGERLAYLPSVGVIAYLLYHTSYFLQSVLVRRSLYVLVCFALFLGARQRMPVWENDLVLFNQTFFDAPQSVKPAVFLSRHWMREKKDLTRARDYLLHIYKLDHTNLYSQKLLLHISLEEGKLDEAAQWASRILKLVPEDPFARQMQAGIRELSSGDAR